MKKNVDDLIKEINYEKQKAIENGLIRKEKPQSEISEKDVYCSLPNTWRWIRLGDYCLKATDYVASGSFASIKSNVNYYNTENYALMVKTADFANNFTKNLTYTDESGYKFLSNSNLFGGELILSNIGSIGKIFKVPYLNRPMTLASNTIMIKFTNDELSDYIYYYFKSTYGQNALKSISSGTSMLKFNKTQLKTLPLPIPNLDIQKKIVDALDKAQELIDKRKEQIEQLDELVKSRFIEMFGDPITNPKGWKSEKLGNICTISRGGSPRPIDKFLGGPIPWIKIGDATKGDDIYLYKTKEGIIEEGIKKSRLIKKGGLIFANCGVSLGFARILKIDGCIHDGWLAFENFEKYLDKIFFLKSLNYCTEYFRRTAPDGTQPNLNTSIMREYVQILPPMEIQQEFAKFIEQVDKLKFEMEKSLKELEDNFNSLMQKAFKGELF